MMVLSALWLITVRATAIDRAFPTAITLGNKHSLGKDLSIDTVNETRGFSGLMYSERIAVDNAEGSV
ncbi:hypothetical protein Q3G72_019591 [Acer saccharum]|nr:hypothetical protein Q3G72_019591 [Acer saccharum]